MTVTCFHTFFQSSAQKDYVVIAAPTPKDEESAGKTVDKEWVSEHARQVGSIPINSQS